jgi:hypothetical protein
MKAYAVAFGVLAGLALEARAQGVDNQAQCIAVKGYRVEADTLAMTLNNSCVDQVYLRFYVLDSAGDTLARSANCWCGHLAPMGKDITRNLVLKEGYVLTDTMVFLATNRTFQWRTPFLKSPPTAVRAPRTFHQPGPGERRSIYRREWILRNALGRRMRPPEP